jgi:hypothetical protein
MALTECSQKLTERSLKLTECSLKLTECSLKLTELSLGSLIVESTLGIRPLRISPLYISQWTHTHSLSLSLRSSSSLTLCRSTPALSGERPPLGCSTPHKGRGGSIIRCGVCVSDRDEVRTFGALWGLEMFSMLSQIANQHFGTKALI